MSENPDKKMSPTDPAFLASRSMDEELGADDRDVLDRALAESAELRGVQSQFRAVDSLVRRVGEEPVVLDWDHHAALIGARIEHGEALDGELDAVLDRWAAHSEQGAPYDEERFAASVMQRIAAGQDQEASPRRLPFVLRMALPLAAAAAIVFAVSGWGWLSPAAPSMAISFRVGTTPKLGSDVYSAREDVYVAFARLPAPSRSPSHATELISFGSVGAEPLSENWEAGS